MKKIILILSAALLAFSSCSKFSNESIPEGLIVFRESGLPFSASVETKATVVNDVSLASSGFNVSCTTGSAGSESSVWNSVAFAKNGSVFKATSADKWWPSTDPSYHFYASNAALTFNADGPTVAATNGTDVVCAYLPSPTYKKTNTLTFEHIFARITDVTFTAIDGYEISGISVTITPKTGGTYNIRTGAGQTDGTGWSSLTTGTATSIANATPGTKSNDLYLVPGTYTLTASWTATKGPYTKTFTDKTVDIVVVGGKRNSITANLTGDATDVLFSVSVSPWGSNTIAIGTFPTWSAEDFEIAGNFTVDASGTKVRFARGNLQAVIGSGPDATGYNYTASSWKFAEHQWDYIGNAAGNTSFAVGSTVDLFGWVGASASYDSYGLCTNTAANNEYYGTSTTDILKTDWGSIPGVVSYCGEGWRTLSYAEWEYLLGTRTVNGGKGVDKSFTTGQSVNGVSGVVLYPDDYTGSVYAGSDWSSFESAGCVFLPAAGYRNGTGVLNAGANCRYWSSTPYSNNAGNATMCASFMTLILANSTDSRSHGISIRLARTQENALYLSGDISAGDIVDLTVTGVGPGWAGSSGWRNTKVYLNGERFDYDSTEVENVYIYYRKTGVAEIVVKSDLTYCHYGVI